MATDDFDYQEEFLRDQYELIKTLDPDSKAYQQVADAIDKAERSMNEKGKLELARDEAFDNKIEGARKEKREKKEFWANFGKALGTFALTLGFAWAINKKGLEFEETGHYTSKQYQESRNTANKLLFK